MVRRPAVPAWAVRILELHLGVHDASRFHVLRNPLAEIHAHGRIQRTEGIFIVDGVDGSVQGRQRSEGIALVQRRTAALVGPLDDVLRKFLLRPLLLASKLLTHGRDGRRHQIDGGDRVALAPSVMDEHVVTSQRAEDAQLGILRCVLCAAAIDGCLGVLLDVVQGDLLGRQVGHLPSWAAAIQDVVPSVRPTHGKSGCGDGEAQRSGCQGSNQQCCHANQCRDLCKLLSHHLFGC
mmetsp:Transcript_5931/g.16110  ORF Transcript_5931/g.16110 Transcript_5931/m.16110 type:complete len:236 (+) Transcript_5931:524-1231(+)